MIYGDYPEGVQFIIKQRVDHFSKDTNHSSSDSVFGFIWDSSKEGYDFWRDILEEQNYERFYEQYPYLRYYTETPTLDIISLEPRIYIARIESKKYRITIEEITDVN